LAENRHISCFPFSRRFAVIRSPNPFFSMKKTRRRTACEGAGAGVVLEGRAGSGPWDGFIDPGSGNTAVRRFMKWYRQRLDLSLHQAAALTGIDRAYLRRLERRRIRLSLEVLWRWCNGLHVNVEWVLRMARRHEQERVALKAENPGASGGGLAAPFSNPPGMAESPHASHDHPLPPEPSATPAAAAAAPGSQGGGAAENSFPAGGEGAGGSEKSFPEDVHFADLSEKSFLWCGYSPLGLENCFPRVGYLPLGLENSFLAPVLIALLA